MRNKELREALSKRILVLDGAMGTQIQRFGLEERDFRGERFDNHQKNLKGCNDVLCLTQPNIVADIHHAYLDAGADIIETNSFNANAVSLAEYGLDGIVAEINQAAARIARREAGRMALAGRKCWVAGSVGPTSKTLSLSADVDDPASRELDFDTLKKAYVEQMSALIAGGVDILQIETIFDTLNAKAAIVAAHEAMQLAGKMVETGAVSDAFLLWWTDTFRTDIGGVCCQRQSCKSFGSRIELRIWRRKSGAVLAEAWRLDGGFCCFISECRIAECDG